MLLTPPSPPTAALRSADSLIRSITWRYHSYDAAFVLNDILLPSIAKQIALCQLWTWTVKHLCCRREG